MLRMKFCLFYFIKYISKKSVAKRYIILIYFAVIDITSFTQNGLNVTYVLC